MMKTSEAIEQVDYQGVLLTRYRCSCGGIFYAKSDDTEVKSCGHERAKRDAGSFVVTQKETSAVIDRIRSGTANESDKELAARLFKGVVRRGAYRLWEEAGRPEGRAEEFWHESELRFRGYLASM